MTMHWFARAGLRLVAAGVAVLGLGGAAAAAGTVSAAAGGPGSQLWVSAYNGPYHGYGFATAIAASPDGKVVFVAGRSAGAGSSADYATVAYDAATGAQLWVSRFSSHLSGGMGGIPQAVAVSPDGATVYVTGQAASNGLPDYMTIAYDAATGAQRWARRYSGPTNSFDDARSVAVSPDGRTVFVTGYSGRPGAYDYVTIAYNAATGARRWFSRYNGPAGGNDQARALAVSPDGRNLYVTGRSQGRTSGYDIATVAYSAATGTRLWVRRYNGPANLSDFGTGVVVAPRGKVVYVTGGSRSSAGQLGWATIAYKAATSRALWTRRSTGWSVINGANSFVGVTPNGQSVLVANYTAGTTTRTAYQTTAYNAGTGALRWARRYAGPAGNNDNLPSALGISPDGTTVYVTGTSDNPASESDYATVAYQIGTGARLWVSRFTGLGNSFDEANALVVNPKGGAVYVTGSSAVSSTQYDFATVAYLAG